jgi:uncharacterized protein (DUF2252 family)
MLAASNSKRAAMKTFSRSIADYEGWLAGELGEELVADDLGRKHRKMRKDAFGFLRATYWRWSEIVFDLCGGLERAPPVLAVGDTHLENFGTWRDVEGRLVWGVNDFDDAAVMPYALDLVRLAASAILAGGGDGLSARGMARLILAGYARGLDKPSPVILEHDHAWLRRRLLLSEKEREAFWENYAGLEPGERPAPARFVEALAAALPEGSGDVAAMPVTRGTGSLGRPRFVAYVRQWRGGPVLREAKALLPSAWSLAHDPADREIRAAAIAGGRRRSPDPHYKVSGRILVRRLSPNSRKIEVKSDARALLSGSMLELMGLEIANCHADDPQRAAAIREDLAARGDDWLYEAARDAASATEQEWKAYRAAG